MSFRIPHLLNPQLAGILNFPALQPPNNTNETQE